MKAFCEVFPLIQFVYIYNWPNNAADKSWCKFNKRSGYIYGPVNRLRQAIFTALSFLVSTRTTSRTSCCVLLAGFWTHVWNAPLQITLQNSAKTKLWLLICEIEADLMCTVNHRFILRPALTPLWFLNVLLCRMCKCMHTNRLCSGPGKSHSAPSW
jgi:hypothetical protein